jgi:hypothetical protein
MEPDSIVDSSEAMVVCPDIILRLSEDNVAGSCVTAVCNSDTVIELLDVVVVAEDIFDEGGKVVPMYSKYSYI